MSDSTSEPIRHGMRLSVRHRTRFDYDGPVLESYNDIRLRPVSDPLQRCVVDVLVGVIDHDQG